MIWALHGAVGSSSDWLDFSASISQRCPEVGEVRRLDLWRFLDCCSMPLEKVGAAIAGQIARIDPNPILLGYSMGGRLALHALLADPKFWSAAIIVSAHPGLRHENERVIRRRNDARWSAQALKGDWLEFLKNWESQGVLQGSDKRSDVRSKSSSSRILPDRRGLKKRRNSIARSFVDWSLGAQSDLSERFSKISCPVLWVTGEDDVKFSQLATSVVKYIPDVQYVSVPQCGHRVPWEQAEVFDSLCADFIKKVYGKNNA